MDRLTKLPASPRASVPSSRNDGNSSFTDVTEQALVGDLGNHYGAVWGDYDNDGDLDLYVVDVRDIAENKPNLLYQNNGDGTFTESAFDENVTAVEAVGRHYGAAWGDYNNDGFLDLFLSNGLDGDTLCAKAKKFFTRTMKMKITGLRST